ncbi:MAG: hypothetical protein AAB289_11805 [Chloroflexota bacterium]
MDTTTFTRFAGMCGILAGVSTFLYAISVLVIARGTPHLGALFGGLFLLMSGLFVMPVFVALYHRLMQIDRGFALWGVLLGVISAAGAIVHGGSDFTYVVHAADAGLTADVLGLMGLSVYAAPGNRAAPDLPNAIDPLGLLTFGLASMAVFVVSWLMGRSHYFPKRLQALGYLLAASLAFVYIMRLIDNRDVLTPQITVAWALSGFFAQPGWYVWLGSMLWRNSDRA